MRIVLNACRNEILYEYLSEEFIALWKEKARLQEQEINFSRDDLYFIETIEEMNYKDDYRNADNEYIFLRLVDIKDDFYDYHIVCHGEEESLEVYSYRKKIVYIYDILSDEYIKYEEVFE
jgi:hypothetical protein